jgi:2-keto-4-pentenoate hydratase/2-oxohepta-3-ene-1,7-dioic acid hydratase in catechol pathway
MTLWVRYMHEGAEGFGTLDGGVVAEHTGDLFAGPQPSGRTRTLAEISLAAPVRPRLFIGLWNNFHALAAKQGNAIPETPLFFLKSPASVIGPEAAITPPAHIGRIAYEGELGIVIGQRCRDCDEAAARSAIFGYTCVNDVTGLDLFAGFAGFDQWARAKSCDSFGPVGPAIATGLDWQSLRIITRLAGRVRQDYPASDMILPPARIVSLLSREMTLHPGDLIACGTSLGVLPMRSGMEVQVEIEGIGALRNRVAAA